MTTAIATTETVLDAELVFDPDYDGTYATDWNYDQAAAATAVINDTTGKFAEDMDELMFDAFSHRVWVGLGYETWEGWRGSLTVRKSVSERRALTAKMHKRGMSTRAIGAALGNSEGTVRNDLKASAQDYAVEPLTDSDGNPIVESEKITGTNGKSYKRPEPKPAKEVEPPKAPRAKAQRHLAIATGRVEELAVVAENVATEFAGEILDDSVTPKDAVALLKQVTTALTELRKLSKALKNRADEADEK